MLPAEEYLFCRPPVDGPTCPGRGATPGDMHSSARATGTPHLKMSRCRVEGWVREEKWVRNRVDWTKQNSISIYFN